MYSIKTYAPNSCKADKGQRHCFYILNKGNNSGRPNWKPHANSFAITAESQEEAKSLYWVAYTLWQSRELNPYIIGSVIPFIRMKEYKKQFAKALTTIEGMEKIAPALTKVQAGIDNAKAQINTYEQVKILLARKALGLLKK